MNKTCLKNGEAVVSMLTRELFGLALLSLSMLFVLVLEQFRALCNSSEHIVAIVN